MAINPSAEYPSQTEAPSADYPYGASQNVIEDGDGTGTPWEKALIDDHLGFQQALLSSAGIAPSGTPDKVGASQYLDAMTELFSSNSIRKYGYIDGVTIDATAIVNEAFSDGAGVIDFEGYEVTCSGDVLVPPSSSVRGIKLSGGKLTISTGVLTIQTPHSFAIDLGGGEIDLGLKKAQLAIDAPNGNVFNVVDASEFSVGDVVTCSFDLNKLPNDPARSTLPGNVFNTITDISGNQITMAYSFAANGGGGTPGYTSIPAGAWIINGIFTKPGILYTGDGTFTISNGNVGNTSAGYAVSVNNQLASFISRDVRYDDAGLDMFNLKCLNIIFDGFHIGRSLDVAKQAIVPEWSGLFYMSKGKFKRDNFDGEFYLSSSNQLGDMHLVDVTGDGEYGGDISTGSFSGNSLFVCKMPAANLTLRSLKLDRCRFTNYQRNGFGSGDDVVTTATINAIEITDSECNVPWLRTTFADPSELVNSDYIKISGGSMGCSSSYRQNAGFSNVNYDRVDLIAGGVVRYLNCQIDNCAFNGGSHAVDSPTILIGENSVINGGKLLMQTGQITTSAKIRIPDFKAVDASGTFFPVTSYVDSSLGSYHPGIELVVPDFAPRVKFGNQSASIKYTIELSRPSETSAPFDCRSRHAVYIVGGSLVYGVADNTLYKSTVASTSVLSVNYSSGETDLIQNNSGTLPAIGDIFAVLYANQVVGYHYISAAAGNSFTISPPLREDITTTTICGLNKMTKLY